MKRRSTLLFAAACALCACGPGQPSLPPAEAPPAMAEDADTSGPLMPDDPDLRSKVEKMVLNTQAEGIHVYTQVSQDFPEEFNAFIDAMTAAMRARKPMEEVTMEGARFGNGLLERYSGNIKDAGPEKIRTLLNARLALMHRILEVQSVDDCNRVALDSNFNNLDTSQVRHELIVHAMATWSAMKAGVANPHPQAPPTAADRQALAKAAVAAGASPELIDNWLAGGLAPDNQKCELAVALETGELAMRGPAAERIQASGTITLPP